MESWLHDNKQSLDFYRQLVRVRSFEERVSELFVRGGTAGSMLHVSIGEEAAAVGVGSAMADGDTFTTHHRGHGVFLARGGDPNRMMAEIAGKESGYCRGKGGSMHIADMALGHLGANAIVGGGIPAVVGAGLSSQQLDQGRVSVAFFGDGAMQQGILYESMNMAALWKLPVLFVCINNQYGMGTRVDHSSSTLNFPERARAFGLAGAEADGQDVEQVFDRAQELIAGTRAGTPGFLSVECYRFFGHARKDKSPYRDEAEEEQGRQRDPIARQRDRLIEGDPGAQAACDDIDAAARAEMDAAVAFAVDAPAPDQASMFGDVYDPSEPAPVPLARVIDEVLPR